MSSDVVANHILCKVSAGAGGVGQTITLCTFRAGKIVLYVRNLETMAIVCVCSSHKLVLFGVFSRQIVK